MNEKTFINIKDKLKNYKYSSLEYTEFQDVSDYEVLVDNEDIFLLYGFNTENKIHEYHWAANESGELLGKINKNALVTFVPKDWYEEFKNNDFITNGIWNDYFNTDINKHLKERDKIEVLKEEDCKSASELTRKCRNQSRGFSGQTVEWMKQWISGSNSEYKDSTVLVFRMDDIIAGIVCLATYGHTSQNGTIVWIREIAVLPEHQNRGIASKLMNQALHYGNDHGATRGFLAADESNENAIKLYEKFGFESKENEIQIDMIKL